jgi:hypothetical protein
MIDVKNWKVGQIGNKKFTARQRLLDQVVRFHLIIFVVQIEHSRVSRAQIDDPAKADVPLH